MAASLYLTVCAVVLLVGQSALGNVVQIGMVVPDLFVLFMVYLVSVLSPSRALVAAWGLGLMRDCWTPAPLGVDAGAMVCAAGLVLWAHRRFVLDTDIALVVLTFGAALVHGAVWAGVLHLTGNAMHFPVLLLRIVLPAALYGALVMPVFARVLRAGLRLVVPPAAPRLA